MGDLGVPYCCSSALHDSLRPMDCIPTGGLQHSRFLWLPPSSGVWSNPCPSSSWRELPWWLRRWCYLTGLSSVAPFFAFRLSQHQGLIGKTALHIRWPNYWNFSSSSSSDYSRLISFRIDWVWSLGCPRDSQESSSAPQFERVVTHTPLLLKKEIATHSSILA